MDELIKNQVGKGKSIIITGASAGLGAGMAEKFAKMGYNLGICARRINQLEQLKTDILSHSPNVHIEVRSLDVADYDAVFTTFEDFAQTFGQIDRVIVNAGIGDGRGIGKGHFEINRKTAEINFISALAQCEAAMQIFRRQNSGHLVAISSMSAMRGLPKHLTTYAATKAGLAHLAEGIRADMLKSKLPIKVTNLYPGYIRTEINAGSKNLPFAVDIETGTREMVEAIESDILEAYVPKMPWVIIAKAMKTAPLHILNKLS
ncbi:SDR family oxidoreductase [Psychrobacter sp. HD31]|uniref:SDR family oxidoreductase n=1 Tax=Psychrobacter sp. HD31 TaxID=3112003 RepID=UPI003DA3F946